MNGTTTPTIQINRFSGGASASLGELTAFGTNEGAARALLREKRSAMLALALTPPEFIIDPTGATRGWLLWHEGLTFRAVHVRLDGTHGCSMSEGHTSSEGIRDRWAAFVADWREHAENLA